MKLESIKIENFKGLKHFAEEFSNHTVIKGMNGSGKTTVYDAFLWLLFGKDSDGKKDFEIHPLDENNQPIEGLVTVVEGVIDGTTFKKQRKRKVKTKTVSYETLCWIDDVSYLAGKYADKISAMIPEDTFKLLTDLRHYNSLHWSDRRGVLLDVVGETGTPAGFDELVGAMAGRPVDAYKKVISDRKKVTEEARDEIPIQINENQLGLVEYAHDTDLAGKRDNVLMGLSGIGKKRDELFATEKARQNKIDKIGTLKGKKADRVVELKSDTSGFTSLLDEKAKIERGVAKCKQDVADAERDIVTVGNSLSAKKEHLGILAKEIQTTRDEYTKIKDAPTDDICTLCGQKLPSDKIAEVEKKRQVMLGELVKQGNHAKAVIEESKKLIVEDEASLKKAQDALTMKKGVVEEAEIYRTERFAEIQKSIDSREITPPMQDEKWKEISAQITVLEAEVGESSAEQLKKIDDDIQSKQDELAELDTALAQADNSAKAKKRIKELTKKQKELSQQIADLEKEIADIQAYKAAESELVENAVNGMFKHVTFKLFDIQLNGEIDDKVCTAMFNGIPYTDASGGQKIIMGVDVVNVLSKHYGYSVPLFVDNSESLTLPLEADSQTIELYAVEDMELTVERK